MALKILLADDSMTAQNMGKKILSDAGYDVVAVSNGAAAIKKIASDRPDIIILDVYMPGYTGLEVCERIKNARETARTPVLLTVGKMEPFKPEEANRVKADGVMIKPFEATDLLAAVQSMGNRTPGSALGATKVPEQGRSNAPAAGPTPQRDTLRIPSPEEAEPKFDHEATVRLTPEQVRAFQDATYKDWVSSTEEKPVQAAAVAAPAVITPALGEIEIKQHVPALEVVPEQSSATTDVPAIPEDGLIARAIGTHDIFTVERTASASPLVPELVEPEIAINTSVIYEPKAAGADPAEAGPQPFFVVEPAVVEHASELSPKDAELVVETAEPSTVEVKVVPVEIEAVTPQLETSAPVVTGEIPPTILETLEPEAPVTPLDVVAEVAPDLEINSPVHLQPEVSVETDPDLITSDAGEISEFVTKFGAEKPEEISVGMVTDLPEEQQAAIVVPVVLQSEAETAEFPAYVDGSTSVLDEVGKIEAAAPVEEPAVVAYVPGINDTQRFVPAAILGDDSGKISAIEISDHVQTQATPQAPAAGIVESFVSEVPAEVPSVETPVELASAAAAGAAMGESSFEIGPFAGKHSDPVDELSSGPDSPETSVEAPDEPMGDAVLAEELAAALTKTESEMATTTQVEAALEPAISAVVEPISEVAQTQGFSDSKLSDAVARAIEHLKPQLINEILKELTK